jgi:hypothetical protein
VLRNLTKQYFLVVLAVRVDWLARLRHSDEVAPLPFELDLFTVGYEELFGTAIILDFTAIGYFVLGLVVNEDSCVSSAVEEGVEEGAELWVSEYL